MSILITDCERPPILHHPAKGSYQQLACSLKCPYLPCATNDFYLCACQAQRDCSCISRQTQQEICRIPALPALSAMCPSPCGRYLYQLSSEADCIHTRHLGTGELLYAIKAGVFPRDMKLRGKQLLVAGGSSGELLIFNAPELLPYAQFHVRGCCCSADFWRGGLLILCAVEENSDIYTAVLTLAPSKLRPVELLRLEGQPGGLCVCPDGHTAMVGAFDGLMKICLHTGRILWNLPALSLCSHICCRGDMALASGDIGGHVQLLPHEQPWLSQTLYTGNETGACFI